MRICRTTRFGKSFREEFFAFDASYQPLNHGSYGAFPIPVRNHQRQLQDSIEARSDPFVRFEIPKLLAESRKAVSTLLGADPTDVVLVPNVTTAINTVLRNLTFEERDTILYFSFAYPACSKTVQYICESTKAQLHCIDVTFPAEDDEVVDAFTNAAHDLRCRDLNPKLLMFDTVATFPGVCLPWARLIQSCRDNEVLSLIDGAHGVGHIDLSMLANADPDFFTSNCYKWLFTPRACAVFYVPRRNHHLIRSSLPTSHGFQPSLNNEGRFDAQYNIPAPEPAFVDLFNWVATIDQTPYLCIPEAMKFRNTICGGEARIRKYCFDLAEQGGDIIAKKLGTEVMRDSTQSINQCCFTNVRLPLDFTSSSTVQTTHLSSGDGPNIVIWIMAHSMTDHNTCIPCVFYAGAAWVRLSAQIYLELSDFVKAADVLLSLCARVQQGQWNMEQSLLH